MGPDRPVLPSAHKLQFVVADIWVEINEEIGFLDYANRKLALPRLGVKVGMEYGDPFITSYSPAYGRVYTNTSEEKFVGYNLASKLVPSVLYIDTTM